MKAIVAHGAKDVRIEERRDEILRVMRRYLYRK